MQDMHESRGAVVDRFLAWVVGRLSERAARSGRLPEQVIESTSDSIYVKDLDGRDLTAQRALARSESRYRALVHGLPRDRSACLRP